MTKQDIISEKETTKTDIVNDKSGYFPKGNLNRMENDKDLLAEIQKITPENEIEELPLELSTIQNK